MSALNSRLDKLAAALNARTPPVRRYVRLIVKQDDEDTLPELQRAIHGSRSRRR
jgi:hypothetical protein